MEKEFQRAKRLVNKILKQLGDATLDWTIQVNENSADPNHRTYGCMIHTPSERLEPLTWVKDSWEELNEALEKSANELDRDLIDIAEHEAEITRCKRLIAYHEEKIKELTGES
jgi:hypothetical protein